MQGAIQKDKDIKTAALEMATEEIKLMQSNMKDEAARLGEHAEWEEDDAQVQGQFFLN